LIRRCGSDPSGRQRRDSHQAIQSTVRAQDSSPISRRTVGALIRRSIERFRADLDRRDRAACGAAALAEIRLDAGMMDRYPHQLGGGQMQRVAIARNLPVVRRIAQRVYVTERGHIVESGPTARVFDSPSSTLRLALLASALEPGLENESVYPGTWVAARGPA
jgi:ABC-type microcin C transport system duplicated ATPase subunit YejF